MKEIIQYFNFNKKKLLIIVIFLLALVGISLIKFPVNSITIKIYYEKPESGNVQFYWLDSQNDVYSENNVEYSTINHGKSEIILDYNHGDIKNIRIDFINEKKVCVVKKIDICIAGIIYKRISADELVKYIENTSNIAKYAIKKEKLVINPATADPSVEFNKEFDSLVLNGFRGNYNIYNVISCLFLLSLCLLFYKRNKIKKGIKENSRFWKYKYSTWFQIYLCISVNVMYLYMFVKQYIIESKIINWTFVIVWLYCLLFVVAFFIKDMKIIIDSFLKKQIIIFFFAIYNFIVIELISDHLLQVLPGYVLFNIMLYYFVINITDIFIPNLKISIIIVNISSFILVLADYYIMIFRGSHFVPWDIRAISTAFSVMGSYKISLDKRIIIGIICIILEALLVHMLIDEKRIKKYRQIILSGVGLLIIVISLNTNSTALWDIDSEYSKQGFTVGFFSYIKYMSYSTPKGYSRDKAQEIIDGQSTIKGGGTKAKNIIVIMNESFSDLRVINNEIIDDSYMPYYDSLKRNVIKGNLYVPVFGGGTCNSEFEVLTGVSTRYTPTTPYVTTINKNINSLCRFFDNNGYTSIAFHPFLIQNWNRNNVYPYLGFQKVYDMSDMNEKQYIRWCISDESDYKKVIELYNSNQENPIFVHNVTMQNHGSYSEDYGNLENVADLSQYGNFPQAETYLSLIKQSDNAIEDLCEFFSDIDEPTLICFFGDHQPSIETEFYELLYGKKLDELTEEERMKQYVTPFFIWTNYDIEDQYIDKISANFLGDIIMLTAGYDLSGYDAFTYRLYEKYPVISLNGIYDNKGHFYQKDDLLQKDLIMQYKYLQYYRMNTKYQE